MLRMSDAPNNSASVRERFAGKWQIPAALVSLFLVIVVALQVKSPDRKLTIEQHLDRIVRMVDQRMFVQARAVSERLLEWPELTDKQRGILKLQIARAAYGQAERNLDKTQSGARRIIELYGEATQLGASLTDVDHRRLAQLSERINEPVAAVRHYQHAREKSPGPALDDRRRIIELSEYPLNKPREQIAQMLDAFIDDAQESLGDLAWALGRRLEMLSTQSGWQAANQLIERFAPRFEGASHEAEFDYLKALALWGSRRYDDAERLLRDLMGRVTVSDPVYPKAGWLLGQVVMFDGQPQRPQEALSIFRDVISSRADRYYVTASWVGMAEAQAYLRRHREALDAYRAAIEDIASTRGHRLVNPDTIRASLTVFSNQRRQAGDLETALEYLQLAMELLPKDNPELLGQYLDRLGDLQAAVGRSFLAQAESTDDADERDRLTKAGQQLLEEAGESYFAQASINTLNETVASRAMWSAAGMFDEAGRDERAIDVLRTYLAERPDSAVIPHLLLRLGNTLKRVGRCAEAVEVFQKAYSEYPRSIHANAALIPLAECFMVMGEEHFDKAKTALLAITEDSDIYTPAAPEYREALLLLGTLFSRQDRFEEAIVYLEEFLTNYGQQDRAVSALFLTAEAYRKSAMAIKQEILSPDFSGDTGRLASERIRRLRVAVRLYADMQRRAESVIASESRISPQVLEAYKREALLNRAWTLFELGQYQDALRLYEQAAWAYRDSVAGLGAFVQAINCHVYLGNDEQSRLALRRALYLVNSIPDEAFEQTEGLETREHWRRYFTWVGEVLSQRERTTPLAGASS